VADDDGHIREVVRFALDRAGYSVVEAEDGRVAWNLLEGAERGEHAPFDLIVLDILMPGLDGLEICRRLPRQRRTPLIFLSSKDEELDRILGLELGADDYVTKPFSPRELVARVKAALRRFDDVQALLEGATAPRVDARGASNEQSADTLLTHGPVRLDSSRHKCWVGDAEIVLTVSEFGLLAALLESPGRVLSRQVLVERAYGQSHFLSDRTVDSHIRRIRGKLKTAGYECIETVYGVGYRVPEPEA
jgi:two-component system OmpR family response regulator